MVWILDTTWCLDFEVGEIQVKIMKWEVSLEVGSMAYSTNSYLKIADFYVFWDWKWVISST